MYYLLAARLICLCFLYAFHLK